MLRIYFIWSLFLLPFLLVGQTSISSQMQEILDNIYESNKDAVGILVHVESPHLNISWSGAAGINDKETGEKLMADQPALIASSIKTYVAAAILRLVEEQHFSIDDSISPFISAKSRIKLREDGYVLEQIKIKHLLSHTSGIWNYANLEYIEHKKAHPNYRWTRDEQISRTVQLGEPVNLPGVQFHYSDANYLLLTEVIEHIMKEPFYMAFKKLLKYQELGLKSTWFPTLEKKPTNTKELAHQYWTSYEWDTYELDISWDLYGGGGIACTMKDLAVFTQSYFNGLIINNDSIQNLIYTEIPTKETEMYPYYLGLSQDNYHGMNAYGHGGFWSTVMMYFPSINSTISVCILDREKRSLRRNVLNDFSKLILDQSQQFLDKNKEIINFTEKISDFSGVVLVAQDDNIVFEEAYGFANIEDSIKNNLRTKFNIASISKLLTATAIFQLIEEEKIQLNDTVGQFLPDYPKEIVRDSVTIAQLLTHTSGIPPFYTNEFMNVSKISLVTVNDYMDLFNEKELNQNPGAKYEYSGSGFVILGRIIEQISGMDYYSYIQKNIFDKAKMSSSMACPIDSLVTNKANGYTCMWGDQSFYSRNDYFIAKASPAGGHYCTSNDLFQFFQALSTGILISKKTFEVLTSPQVKGYNTHLGYCIDIDRRYNEQIIGHSGGWYGVRTELMHFMSSDYTVVVLSNMDDNGNSGASELIEEMKVIIAGKKKN